MTLLAVTASEQLLCYSKRELRNFQDAEGADFISVPSPRAWEEVIVTYEPENSSKRLRVVGIYPASLWHPRDAS